MKAECWDQLWYFFNAIPLLEIPLPAAPGDPSVPACLYP